MKKANKPQRGGARKGAGRKAVFKEPTTTVAFRVPVSAVPEVKEAVEKVVARHRA